GGGGGSEGACKGRDGGARWSAVNAGLTHRNVWWLSIDPRDPSTLYAGTQGGGVFRSTDGGATWSAESAGLTNLTVLSVAIDPRHPSTVYLSTGGNSVFASRGRGGSGDANGASEAGGESAGIALPS